MRRLALLVGVLAVAGTSARPAEKGPRASVRTPAGSHDVAKADAPKVGWMVYPYKLAMAEGDYRRLLRSQDVQYVGLQLMASPAFRDELTRDRIAELVAAGKRVVLQIWFGPGPPVSWERYNFPNIALDPEIRAEFFARATDPMIDYFGPKNLYAVHLLEETGMQFGWDVDMPGRPDRDDDGRDNGNSYDNPPNWIMDRCVSGPNVLTIRKHNDVFRAMTGLDMRFYPIWSTSETQRYNDWVQRTLEAGAHVEFARHVHRKYPGLRVYAFNSGTAIVPQSQVLDGQFLDPYTDTVGVYMAFKSFRSVMRPEEDLVGMTWGNREKPVSERLQQQAACYAAGCNVLSTFGDGEHRDDRWLDVVRRSVRPFLDRPVFRARSRVLVLRGGRFGATLQYPQFWITGFAHYEVADSWADDAVRLDGFDLVLSWSGSHRGLLPWVRAGGVLVAMLAPNEFLVEEGYLGEPGGPARSTLDYRPDAWMRDNLKLQASYPLELDHARSFPVKRPDDVHQDRFLYVVRYGKGLVVLLPALPYVHPPWKYEPSWEPYRQLLTDLCRGALAHVGKAPSAQRFFDDPQKGNDYLKITSDDGRTTVYILLTDTHGPEKSRTSFVVPGKDHLSGRLDARLCPEQPVILVDEEAK